MIGLTVAILLFSCLFIGIVFYNTARKSLDTSVRQTISATMNGMKDLVESRINENFARIESLAAHENIKDLHASVVEKCKELTAVSRAFENLENIGYYDTAGNSYTADGRNICIPDREYLQSAFKGKRFFADPAVSPVNNQLMQIYSVPVYDSSNRIIGAVCENVYGKFWCDLAKSINIGKNGHPKIVNMKTGAIIVSEDITEMEKAVLATDKASPEFTKVLRENVMAGKTDSIVYRDSFRNEKMVCACQPVGDSGWALYCVVPYNDFFSQIGEFAKKVVFITIFLCLIAFAITFFTVGVMLKPLDAVKKAITDIASGNADLTRRVPYTTRDEIGDVVIGFNKFSEKMQDIFKRIKLSKENLYLVGTELTDSTSDTSNAIAEIISHIENVLGQISTQAASVEQTAGAVNEIASNIKSLENMIEGQSQNVTQASAAVEQMIGNIASVNSSVDKMASSFLELETNARSGSDKQEKVNEKITEIEQQSQMLQDANIAIASIAEQTNLLAMNAAIEAAHAGEAGKGFSVVADEIRKLSETSSAQSKTIGDQLIKIRDLIENVVASSKDSSKAFQVVADKIIETDELVRQIKAAMEEQTEGSKQITDALHYMNDSTTEVRCSSSEMGQGANTILEAITNLQDVTFTIKSSISEMEIGSRKINETGAALSGISSKVSDSINEIDKEVNSFKV